MARRPSSAARPHTNGSSVNGGRLHTNGDLPPPSTLAAQIVQNQVRPEATHDNGEKATFSGLLQEILHSGAAPETDPPGVLRGAGRGGYRIAARYGRQKILLALPCAR